MDIVTYALCKKYTDEEVQHIIDLGPFRYAGSVADYEHLPTTAPKGTVYTTLDTEDEYVFDGEVWIKFGPRKGNVMFATFEINSSTGLLSMFTDEGYSGPDFAINNSYLEVII